MAGVTFNEEQNLSPYAPSTSKKGMLGFVISVGLAKNEAGAQRILLGAAGLFILAAIVIFVAAANTEKPVSPYVEGQNVLLPPQGTAH